MELLRGEDMAALRNRVRSASPSGLVPISIATYLARQMLSCIKCMHEKGFVHRDVKPSNFVRRSKESTEFCVIDFGLTKQVFYYFIYLKLGTYILQFFSIVKKMDD